MKTTSIAKAPLLQNRHPAREAEVSSGAPRCQSLDIEPIKGTYFITRDVTRINSGETAGYGERLVLARFVTCVNVRDRTRSLS
jgi:hypothetical protein